MNLKQEFEDLNSDYFELWFKVLKEIYYLKCFQIEIFFQRILKFKINALLIVAGK